MLYISVVVVSHPKEEDDKEYCVFDLDKMNRKIASMKVKKKCRCLVGMKSEILGLKMYEISRLSRAQSATQMSPHTI